MSEWKKIPNFDNYSINKEGFVKNDTTNRVLIKSLNKKGYVRCCLRKDNTSHIVHNHRVVAVLFCPKPVRHQDKDYSQLEVNHIDGNKANCNYKNLEWVTGKENTKHAYDNGLVEEDLTVKATEASLPILSLKTKTTDSEGNTQTYASVKDLSKKLGMPLSTLQNKIKRNDVVNGLRIELIRPPLKQEEGLIPVRLFIPEKIKSFIRNTKEAYGKKKFYFVLNDNNLNDVVFKPNESLVNRWYFCKHGNYKLVYSTDDFGRAYIDVVPIDHTKIQDVQASCFA